MVLSSLNIAHLPAAKPACTVNFWKGRLVRPFFSRPLALMVNRRALLVLLATAALLALALWAYRPGLSGDFLFDDFGTLPALGAGGSIDNADALGRYLTSGGGDPTGRPLALASFLVDANDWPADPYPFKHTNMLLHLLNGMLLCWLLLRLGRGLRLAEPLACNAAATIPRQAGPHCRPMVRPAATRAPAATTASTAACR